MDVMSETWDVYNEPSTARPLGGSGDPTFETASFADPEPPMESVAEHPLYQAPRLSSLASPNPSGGRRYVDKSSHAGGGVYVLIAGIASVVIGGLCTIDALIGLGLVLVFSASCGGLARQSAAARLPRLIIVI